MRHYSRHPGTNMSRRLFLAGSVMAGCLGASVLVSADASPSRQVSDAASGDGPPGPGPTGAGPAALVPAAEAVPGKDAIVAEFEGEKPTQWGLQVSGTASRLPAGSAGTLLSFDCCGGPGGNQVDQDLIDLLTRTGTPAIFFLNARWVQANPKTARDLAGNPLFEIGNHGTRHVPLSVTGRSAYGIRGTASPAEVYDEVMASQDSLHSLTGKTARFFRPGTAYLDDTAAAIVRRLGLVPVSFSINGDGGATYTSGTVLREVTKAKAADIIIAHANHPGGGTAPGMAAALPALQSSGRAPVKIEDTTAAAWS